MHDAWDLEEEFAKWLNRTEWRWTHWWTLTFREPRWRDASSCALKLAQFSARTAMSAWGFSFEEHHRDGNRLHVHSLCSIQPSLFLEPSERSLWDWWFKRYGRCKIDRIRPEHRHDKDGGISHLASYLCKYVTKETSQLNWDFWAFSNQKPLTAREFKSITSLSPDDFPD